MAESNGLFRSASLESANPPNPNEMTFTVYLAIYNVPKGGGQSSAYVKAPEGYKFSHIKVTGNMTFGRVGTTAYGTDIFNATTGEKDIDTEYVYFANNYTDQGSTPTATFTCIKK